MKRGDRVTATLPHDLAPSYDGGWAATNVRRGDALLVLTAKGATRWTWNHRVMSPLPSEAVDTRHTAAERGEGVEGEGEAAR